MGKSSHAAGKLVPVTLKKLPDGWHADGGNLYLFVRGVSRSWVFRYVGPDGKRKNMGLGSLEAVTLAQAREHAKQLREQVKHPLQPIDPLTTRQEQRTAARLQARRGKTFKECAEAFLENKRPEWSNPKHAMQWEKTLEEYAYPKLGDLPVSAIDTDLVMSCLTPIWTTKTETASRVRGRIEAVLDWATVSKYRHGENPARWRGHLDKLLAKPSKVASVGHHPALPYAQIGNFMADLQRREGIGARALEFAILTAARSGEVRGAKWSEIDLKEKVWTIPAERMKAKREHRVPLTAGALKLLEALPLLENSPHIFPSSKPGVKLSDMTLTATIRRINAERKANGDKAWTDRDGNEITVHGFRSTFRDWAAERTNYPSEMAEMALAHTISNAVEAAYRRGDMFEKRRRMMADWARYCEMNAKNDGVVIAMKGAA